MNITAALKDLHLNEFDPYTMTLGVFIDGECRGSIDARELSSSTDHRYLLLAYGNRKDQGKALEFRFLDNQTGEILGTVPTGLEFLPDGITGKVTDPVILEFDGASNTPPAVSQVRIYPNPTSSLLNVALDLESDQRVTIDVLTIDGRTIESVIQNVEHPAGYHTFRVNLSGYVSGMYLVKVTTGERVTAERVMKN